jgi:predicted nucleotidyltransferase
MGPRLVEQLRRALEAREEVLFAYLFGSRASGRTHLHSDVDVAVYSEPRSLDRLDRAAPWGYVAEVSGRLSEALETDDLNVVILNHAPPLLADRVARNGYLLFSRDESRRQRWIVETKSRYCDLAFLRRQLRRGLMERVRTGRFGARTE